MNKDKVAEAICNLLSDDELAKLEKTNKPVFKFLMILKDKAEELERQGVQALSNDIR